jgi:hypothetical protein
MDLKPPTKRPGSFIAAFLRPKIQCASLVRAVAAEGNAEGELDDELVGEVDDEADDAAKPTAPSKPTLGIEDRLGMGNKGAGKRAFNNTAHIMGVVVRETTMEIKIATDNTTANSWNSRPMIPPMRTLVASIYLRLKIMLLICMGTNFCGDWINLTKSKVSTSILTPQYTAELDS